MVLSKLISVMIIGCILAINAFAADPCEPNKVTSPARHATTAQNQVQLRLEELTTHLDLTKKQQDTVKPFLIDEAQKLDALTTKGLPKKEYHRAAGKIIAATHKKIEALLTDPQKQKLAQWTEQMQEQHNRKSKTKDHDNVVPDINSVDHR
jgi:hypothetical protein